MILKRPQTITSQVNSILRKRIRDGAYTPGSKLPSESDLAAELGVSRATLRQAMTSLVSEGMLLPRQGDGTYVNRRVFEISTRLESFWSFTHMIENSGRKCTIHVLSTQVLPAGQRESDVLEIAPEEPIYVMERLFLADEQPVILSTNIVPVAFFSVPPERCDARVPLNVFLETYCDQWIAYSTSDIRSALPVPQAVERLQLDSDEPLLTFFDVFYNRADQPVAFGLNNYADKRLNMRLVRAWGA